MKKGLVVLASLLAAVTLASAAPAADTLEDVKKKGFLAVGVRDNTPPMGFLDMGTGKIVGIEIDLAEAIAKKIGVPLKLVPILASERVDALHEGKVDLVAASFSKTPGRAKVVDFSQTYFTTRQRILAKKGVVSTLKDLEGKKIAVVKGTTSEMNLREKIPSATVLPLSNMKYVIDVLARGEVDIVSGDGITLYGYYMSAPKEKKDQFEMPKDIALADENYGMAVRLGDKKLLEVVDGVLTELKTSGEGEKIYSKWLRGAPGAPAPAAAAPKGSKDAAAAAPAPAPSAPKAGGAIVRRTAAAGRFVAITLKGVFVDGAEVTIYGSQGQVVCRGKVANVYGDDVYVDAIGDRSEEVAPGFAVGMGIPDEEAKQLVLARQDVLQNVRTESRKEAEARQKEIAADYKADQAQRLEYQKQVQTTQTQMSYQYDSWGHGYGGGWGGYYRW